MGREAQRLHLPVKTQCFVHLGISCELGNRKMGRETDRRHLLVKSQCLAQFGRRSAACTLMFPQQSLETKRCENIRERVGTVDGRNIQTPSIRYNTPTPKVQCYCNLKCVSPSGRKKTKPLTSLLLTRALKHWDLGVPGFNIVRAAGFEYFVHLL